jgi:membrane fusion protein (multidrug efflux system)
MKVSPVPAIVLALVLLSLSACDKSGGHEEKHEEHHKMVLTTPVKMDVVTTQQYVSQIHSCKHIEIRALESGYLQEITVKEGQFVKKDDVLFKVLPLIYQAKLATKTAEAELAKIKYDNTVRLNSKNVVSIQEVGLAKAELDRANAEVQLAQTELNFTDIKAPFDGIMDRLNHQQGSFIKEDDVLTTLSDNSLMWVYFNVPEKRYLEYTHGLERHEPEPRIELVLADTSTFPQPGKIGAIEADFNHETGNIAFRADFPNPKALLRNGQTGTILMHRDLHDAIVIPQQSKFEILDKTFVWVIGEDDLMHQREIHIGYETDDIFVIEEGLNENDRIIFEGKRDAREGAKGEYELRNPEEVLTHLKNRAE